jgi:corrinoid protein of di/trimethylamine methyltransferase
MMDEFLSQCRDAVLSGEKERSADLASLALAKGYDILSVIENGFSIGVRRAGKLWEEGEYFLPELAFSAEAMKAAMEVLKPALAGSGGPNRSKATAVIGTVQGDIHDIGKTLVATMLAADGFRVIDLGGDVPHGRFLDEITSSRAGLLCMSALLTTTMTGQKAVIQQLESEGLRDGIKVMVGGAPTSAAWAQDIGADGYAENAVEAVREANSLLLPNER